PGSAQPDPQTRALLKTWLIIALAAIAAAAVYYGLPSNVNELARRAAAIFVVAAIFWATEVLPLYATSLVIVALCVLLLTTDGGIAALLPTHADWPVNDAGEPLNLPFATFFEAFASPVIILFLGGFLLSAAVTKHGLDRAIASKILSPVSHRPLLLIFAIMGITAFFSMWMSNTATTAMMIGIVSPLLRNLPEGERFGHALILAVPFGANIGGIGTPIGSPPNAIALGSLQSAGINITFVDWMIVGVPLALILLAVAGLLLFLMYRPSASLDIGHIHAREKISAAGKATACVLLAAMALWLTGRWHGIAPAVVALLAAAALTALRVLDRKDVDSIDWNILILMWGGLTLGHAMQTTGLVDHVMQLPIADLRGIALAAVVVFVAAGLSTFMSNTAAATLIIPMAIALSPTEAGELAILVAFACSFAMAMPISTPPNAIAFASGRITVNTMLTAGGIITLIALLLLLIGYQVMIPIILD
ncbi:MAG: DASS family sodium-coupled anion symporter, partial [Phycisphaeraceae bacterium]